MPDVVWKGSVCVDELNCSPYSIWYRSAVVDQVQVNGSPIMEGACGSPDGRPPALRLSDDVRRHFRGKLRRLATRTGRESVILDFARARGRVSSTEAADLAGVTASHAAQMLAALAAAGHLVGSRANRRGRGFHYIPVDQGPLSAGSR